jgi:hypothetical protein
VKPQTFFHLQLTLRRFIVAVFTFTSLLLFYASSIAAQGFRVESASPPTVVGAGTFVSLDGKFSIRLPERAYGFGSLSIPTPRGEAKGDLYDWKTREGRFFAGYADSTQPVDDPEISKRLFAHVRDEMEKTWGASGIKLVLEQPIEFDKHPGMELRFEGPNGFLVRRIYAVSNRLYQTMVVVSTNQVAYSAVVVAVLDTFKILNESDVAAARKEKATAAEPKPLPQEPMAPKIASDLADDGLRGRVNTLFWEAQRISGTAPAAARKPRSMEYYDERGNQTRRDLYDFKGNLLEITVYGYIDGTRVSRSEIIQQEYNPPPIMVAPSGEAPPKRDPRYAVRYTYQYDNKKRLTEMSILGNDGKLRLRYVYKYTDRQKEEWVYSENGSLNQHYLSTLDEQGNEVERTTFKTFPGTTESKYAYVYEFDSQGNWIKRTGSEWVTNDGRSYYEPDNVHYRTITYYK